MDVTFKVPWSGRGHQYTQEEIDLVVEVMKNADPLTQGKYQAEFEQKFSKYLGVQHSFSMTSATAALEIAAMLCKLSSGDEVIIPAHTFAASAIPFCRRGVKIKWADIDPKTFLATEETIEHLIKKKTKVIVLVHLYGQVCDMDPIMSLAKKNNILVVEDVAQALGAEYRGQKAGSIGDFGCYSFHTHKNLTTLGEGGALTVKDPELAKVVPGFRHNGMRGFPQPRDLYWVPAMSNVDFDWAGVWPYNFCQGEVQNALAAKVLERLDQMNADRGQRARTFKESMSAYEELQFQALTPGSTHAYHLLPAHFHGEKWGVSRDNFMKTLAFEKKIKVVVQYYPLYRYPMFQKAGMGEADCPNTDRFFDNMVSFPFHHWMPREQFDYMISGVRDALDFCRKGPQ